MEKHPGVFPKPSHVHNEVKGSWYTVKEILQNVKEKIMGNLQVQNPNPTVDSKASISYPTNGPDKIEVGEEEKGTMSDIVRDTLSKKMMDPPTSEATREKGYLDNVELDKPRKLVQSSLATVDSFAESIGAESKMVGKIFLGEIVQEKNISECTNLVEFNDGQRESKESKGAEVNLDRDLKSKSDQLSCLLTQVDKTSQNSFAGKLYSIGYGNQAETKITSSSPKINVVPDMGERPSSFDKTHKVRGLADLFMKRMNDELSKKPAVKLENQHQQNDETQKSNYEQLYSIGEFTRSQNNTTLQEFGGSKSTSSGYENLESENHLATSSGGVQRIVGLADRFTKTVDNLEEGKVIDTKHEMWTLDSSSEYPKETSRVVETIGDIKGLVDCIKELPRDQNLGRPMSKITSNQSNRSSNGDPNTGVQSQAKTEDEEGGDANFIAFDGLKSKPKPRVPLRMIEKELRKDQNKVIVRFLSSTAEENDLVEAFKGCGDIERVEIFHGTRKRRNFASVYFKTVEGMNKALESCDRFIKGSCVTVQAASSSIMDKMSNIPPIPNLVGDPDAPAALLKNPTRTVMIKPLAQNICSHHIEEALAFCESKISGFFLGSSSTVAYVEFKTEDDKERAIEKRSVVVLGKQLSIIRIDVPRTTVLRISNIDITGSLMKLNPIIESCGRARTLKMRHKSMADVHFKVEEWPNMLKILNK
ncbi:hypothetical protein LguiA_001381 [Lonicera macranthoides]